MVPPQERVHGESVAEVMRAWEVSLLRCLRGIQTLTTMPLLAVLRTASRSCATPQPSGHSSQAKEQYEDRSK